MFRTAALAAIVALTAAPALAQDDKAAAGKSQFDLQCTFCHDGSSGPELNGVHGRKIGGGSYDYSEALKKKEGNWTDENLDAFLKAPTEFAPGTKMLMSVTDDATRANIIAYLKTLK